MFQNNTNNIEHQAITTLIKNGQWVTQKIRTKEKLFRKVYENPMNTGNEKNYLQEWKKIISMQSDVKNLRKLQSDTKQTKIILSSNNFHAHQRKDCRAKKRESEEFLRFIQTWKSFSRCVVYIWVRIMENA